MANEFGYNEAEVFAIEARLDALAATGDRAAEDAATAELAVALGLR